MDNYSELEARIQKIEARNRRVEADKNWETSLARKISIVLITYVAMALFFGLILGVNPWINAIVPTVGFLLSTLSLSFIKHWWIERYLPSDQVRKQTNSSQLDTKQNQGLTRRN